MAALTLAGIVYLLAIREFFATPAFARRVVVIGLVLAAVWHIELLRVPTGAGEDIHRYVWDGRLQRLGYNPYLVVPGDPAVKALHTPETRNLMGAREFALMRPDAYFITTARGFIHDEAALLEALRNKKIAGAGLDVWSKEPPPPDHPLLQFDNVLASPHTAGVTREARANMGRIAAEQVLDALDGKRPPRIVNPEVWPAYAKRFERAFGFAPG